MTDNQLVAALIAAISAGLQAQAISVGIEQNYQPTQQGAPSAPYVILHKIGDVKYGSPALADVYNTETEVMTHTETQIFETTYQVGAVAIQNPANVNSLTAADYVAAVSLALNSQTAIIGLAAQGIGMLRIRAIRQTFFRDEKGLFEAAPSFDFTVSHTRQIASVEPSTDSLVGTFNVN
jgi:hypothetical protein